MGFLDKVKALSEKTVAATTEATQAVNKKYREGGMEGIGKVVGQSLRDVAKTTKAYVAEIERENEKVVSPVNQAYKEGTIANEVAKGALVSINTIRKVALDAAAKIDLPSMLKSDESPQAIKSQEDMEVVIKKKRATHQNNAFGVSSKDVVAGVFVFVHNDDTGRKNKLKVVDKSIDDEGNIVIKVQDKSAPDGLRDVEFSSVERINQPKIDPYMPSSRVRSKI